MEALVKLVCAFILPPLGVLLHEGFTGHFLLNILLTILGYFPGLIHAVWRIVREK